MCAQVQLATIAQNKKYHVKRSREDQFVELYVIVHVVFIIVLVVTLEIGMLSTV